MLQKDLDHLKWVYERMQYIHNERIDVDYMLKFKEILQQEQTQIIAKRIQDNSRYGFLGDKK